MDEARQALTKKYNDRESRNRQPRTGFPFLGYSTLYWIRHAIKCEEENFCPSDVFLYCASSGSLENWLHSNHVFDRVAIQHFPWPTTIFHIASAYNLVTALNAILSQGFKADSRNSLE